MSAGGGADDKGKGGACSLLAWGWGRHGQCGHGDIQTVLEPRAVAGLSEVVITQIAAGRAHSLAVLDDGTLLALGHDYFGQPSVPDFGGRKVVQAAAGFFHSLAVLEDGTLVGFGRDDFGVASPPDFGQARNNRFSRCGWHKPCQHFHRGGFTGAIRPQKPNDFALVNAKRNIVNGNKISVTFG